jgi:hypothetical protein
MPDFGEPEADWTDDYAWTRYRGPQPWPCPADWALDIVEGDGTIWQRYPGVGEGLELADDVYGVFETEGGFDDEAYNDAREERAFLTREAIDVSHRRGEETVEWKLTIDNETVFRRVDPEFNDVLKAAAEALSKYSNGADYSEVLPSTGSVPEDLQFERELEERIEENQTFDDFVTDGGLERFVEHPMPDSIFQQIGDAEIDYHPMDHEDVTFKSQVVPGGSFGFELSLSYDYIGFDCVQNVSLDREAAEALHERLGRALEADPR